MQVDLLIHNIGQLATLAGPVGPLPPGPRRGAAMRELGIIEDGAVAIADGRVAATGKSRDLRAAFRARDTIDAGGRAVVPGFVDPHTHLPWAGHRAAEFEMRIGGATYMQIMAAGGGIARTVADTRAASLTGIVAETRGRLDRMLAFGTTTAEAKTGYGLNVPDELKQLDAIAELQRTHPVDLVPTFLGAHAVPPEYRGRTDAYVALVIDEMLPAFWKHWRETGYNNESHGSTESSTRDSKNSTDSLSSSARPWPIFCDVFCEDGAFDLAQSRRILEAAKRLGFGLKLHADEFAPLGGTPLAIELGAISADHIVTTPPEHVTMLAQSQTIGVALPGTPFGLGQQHYTPARALIDGGGALALATDLNPGTCWCESMQFIIALACRAMRLLPAEALTAATLNAAYAVGLGDQVGSLEPGKLADVLILDADDTRMLAYRFGTNLVRGVVKRGRLAIG
jgi:imidazolonepropionase